MPRRYETYRGNPGLAKMAGGLGMGMAAAGKMAADRGQSMMDNEYRDDQANTQKDQFGKTLGFNKQKHGDQQKLGYARIASDDARAAKRNSLGWANHNLSKQYHNKPSYIVRETDDGFVAYNQYDMKADPIKLGGSKPKVPTALDNAKLMETNQKIYQNARTNAAMHYGDDFESLPAAQQDYLTKEYMNGTRNHKILGGGWFDGDVRVNMPKTQQQVADDNATLQNLTNILAEQNRLLQL